jgi:hypothetical protein
MPGDLVQSADYSGVCNTSRDYLLIHHILAQTNKGVRLGLAARSRDEEGDEKSRQGKTH